MRFIPHILRFLMLCLLVGATGCTSNRINLVARVNGAPIRQPLGDVTLMARFSQTPDEKILASHLEAELKRRGIHVVAQNESEYTVAADFEENWDETTQRGSFTQPVVITANTPISQVRNAVRERHPLEEPIRTEGIRIRIYRTADLRQGSFRTAWEGFIDAGLRLKPEQQPTMLQTLCDYIGRDFIGHVKMPK